MATGAAGDGILRGMFDGCISGKDLGIQRRPYHRNCSCALHRSRGHCSHASKYNNISYPIRRSWSESCLALMVAANNSSSSPCTSPALGAVAAETRRSQLVLCREDDYEDDIISKLSERDTEAVKMMLQCTFYMSIPVYSMEIERRPYHRNCTCALHKLKYDYVNDCPQCENATFSRKNSWSQCNLSIETSKDLFSSSPIVSSVKNREVNEAIWRRK